MNACTLFAPVETFSPLGQQSAVCYLPRDIYAQVYMRTVLEEKDNGLSNKLPPAKMINSVFCLRVQVH